MFDWIGMEPGGGVVYIEEIGWVGWDRALKDVKRNFAILRIHENACHASQLDVPGIEGH